MSPAKAVPAGVAEVPAEPVGGIDDPEGEPTPTVNDHLEMALQVASDTGMSTSELMGIFFYYAHSIAASYRDDVVRQQEREMP